MRFSVFICIALLAFIHCAKASDGAIEISQACAINSGCMPGDSPGFPISLTASGAYVLTSNLNTSQLVNPEVDAIKVLADAVAVDLNGFQIIGPTLCTGDTPNNRVCTPQNDVDGNGIDSEHTGLTVRNGTIRRMPGTGIQCAGLCRVEGVTSSDNAGAGIAVGTSGMVINSMASGNLHAGISANAGEGGAVIEGNTVTANTGLGIVAAFALIRGNSALSNDTGGIYAHASAVIENSVLFNGGNFSSGTNGNGLFLTESSALGNHIRYNLVYGIYAEPIPGGPVSGYGSNVIQGNGGTVYYGVQVGVNLCDGDTTCP